MTSLHATPGKITGGESLRVTGCLCHDETRDKFRFSVSGEDLNTGNANISSAGSGGEMVTHNVQVSQGNNQGNVVLIPSSKYIFTR